jgi:coatomer protein complex subunit gamma
MEPILSDQNRNTATLALTTLLKTGHESNVERLVKQITSFMSEISDVFKIEVVRALKALCLQYPSKYKTLMAFLSSNLREDGTSDFKTDLVDAIITIIGQVPAAREVGLLHLCEFIEDCEYSSLCARILGFLGDEVASTSQPAKFIRFIYNRLILENALVRAASVDALTRIAMKVPGLRKDILVLLEFGQNDNDDEVRERISLYTTVLSKCVQDEAAAPQGLESMISSELPLSMDALYDGLLEHMSSDSAAAPFSIDDLPTEEAYQAQARAQAALTESSAKKQPGAAPGASATKTPAETAKQVAEAKAVTNEALNNFIAQLGGDFGPLQHSSKPKYLTEQEAEYTVQVIKHMFKQHIVLEMYVSNTVQGVTLENVEVKLKGLEPLFSPLGDSSIVKLEYGQQASAYVALQKMSEDNLAGNFGAALRFIVKEEGDDLGYEDDYPIESCVLAIGDYLNPKGMPAGQFKSVWDQMASTGTETQKDMVLNFKSAEAAVDAIIQTLNMSPAENTGKVESGGKGHTLLMTGVFLGGNTCLVKAMVRVHEEKGMLARIACRSRSQFVCDVVAKAML